jgi:DNA-binding transcriptional regulator YhcF (GntR family)
MGLLYTRRGMGVFVNRGIENKCREECRRRTIERMHEVVAEAKAAGMEREELFEVLTRSYDVDAEPYAETPPEVVALAKLRNRDN